MDPTARDGLASSETSRRLGNRPLLANLKGSPRVAGLEGTQPRKGGDRRYEETRVCGSGGRWRGVDSPTKRTVLPSSTVCAKQTPTERPWRRGRQERNIEGRRKKSASPSGLGLARAGVHACARATCLHGRARERERAGVGSHRQPGQCST
jgi:hypothetical protein